MKHQAKTHHDKTKTWLLCKFTCIRFMMYIIAKQTVRTLNMGSYKHVCLKYYKCMSRI